LRLIEVELGSEPRVEPGARQLYRIAPRADRFLQHGELRIQGAQAEVGLRGQAAQRQGDDVPGEAAAEQARARRFAGSIQASPEIDLEIGRGEKPRVRTHQTAHWRW